MNASVDLMFKKMQASRGFNLFGERSVASMIIELKKLDEGDMLGKKVIA